MSTNNEDQRTREMHDPTKDKYPRARLEKGLGRVEYELAADIAAVDKASKDAREAVRGHARSAIGDARRNRGDGRG
jgi:hypothetical protein